MSPATCRPNLYLASVMKRTIILYGVSLAALVFVLKFMEYRVIINQLPFEFFIAFMAMLFTGVGLWAGWRLSSAKKNRLTEPFAVDALALQRSGLSPREYDVLTLMAQGLSNQEIADRLCISLNTAKTHISTVFQKLDARRRTHAVRKARDMRLIH